MIMSSSDDPTDRPQAVATPRIDSKAPKSTTRLGDALIRLSDLVYFLECDQHSKWTWSLRNKDGSVMAVSGQSFATRSECMDSVMRIKTSQHAAVVEE
jgi:uncharacterized protein YegP (UPF0339 family)